ncbi:penicillin-binding protein activator [Pelagibacterium xiamenense]|uniref:penicillin-binding protein activator n=1 Tax=Pelagibacterium xiamenense TaxID=2901140 RepID=UPI001E4A0C51|nr:penicillin-binding protein activator [Pelagibacterium xiamenense]MCD7058466.1 penicillin-binding protein activator [Pelagibacterium xiamenense]
MRGALKFLLGFCALGILAACSPTADFGFPASTGLPMPSNTASVAAEPLPSARGDIVGSGPVRVAMLLPLSGSAANVGGSMAAASRMAMEIAGSNIQLVIKDTGGSASGARAAAQEAVSEKASLILGPLLADAVAAAGDVARGANIPLIGFSNTSAVAESGVYLLNVMPEVEVMRSIGFARAQGAQAVAAVIPDNAYGRLQRAAFEATTREMSLAVRGVEMFSDETSGRQAIENLVPLLKAGQIDTLFLPDRATAPSFAILLEAAGVSRDRIVIVGSADWEGDSAVLGQPYLSGAIYPAVDPNGLAMLAREYEARFGGAPHPFATLAYTAVLLAGNDALVLTQPRYSSGVLTRLSGFTGRDGPFRFLPDGRAEYGLVIKQILQGRGQVLDPVRLGGVPAQTARPAGSGNVIPPVGASLGQ